MTLLSLTQPPSRLALVYGKLARNRLFYVIKFSYSVCPGRDVANRAGFYIVSAIMAMYEILPLDGKSIPDPDTAEYTVELIQ